MVTLEIRDACIVNGDPVEVGGKVTVNQATANILLSMGRAVVAADESPIKAPAETPRPRNKARANSPTTPKED